jgi:hypothetical protein
MKIGFTEIEALATRHDRWLRGQPLSLTHGFSRVSSVGRAGKPLQRYFRLGAEAKPLKRFNRRGAAYTRLNPGVNEIGPTQLCAFASLRLCVKKS